jgi:hypothetical protein
VLVLFMRRCCAGGPYPAAQIVPGGEGPWRYVLLFVLMISSSSASP